MPITMILFEWESNQGQSLDEIFYKNLYAKSIDLKNGF